MKLAVIGADTRLGSRIARDAVHRHNAVTAVVRDASLLQSVKYTVIENDSYDFDATGYDAIIDARTDVVTVTRGDAVSTLTPPAVLDADARRQGYFVIADETYTGESYISEEDFALAVVDETEGSEARSFTPVTERLVEQPKTSRREPTKAHTGIAGTVYRLIMDDYNEYVVHFLTDETMMLAKKGEAFTTYACKCLHCDDGVWIANFMMDRTCVMLILDDAQSLATAIFASPMPKKPRLVKHSFLFGAIAKFNEEIPFPRHGFTDELVGEKIAWHYSQYVSLTHVYVNESYIRSSLHGMKPLPPDAPAEVVREVEDRAKRWADIFFEEPAQYLRINPHLYVVCFVETTRNRIDPMMGGGDMVLVINTRRMRDYGRSFNCAHGAPTFGLLSVAGDWDDMPCDADTAESPFLA